MDVLYLLSCFAQNKIKLCEIEQCCGRIFQIPSNGCAAAAVAFIILFTAPPGWMHQLLQVFRVQQTIPAKCKIFSIFLKNWTKGTFTDIREAGD